MFPAEIASKKGVNQGPSQKMQQNQPQLTPIDVNKISLMFNRCDKAEN